MRSAKDSNAKDKSKAPLSALMASCSVPCGTGQYTAHSNLDICLPTKRHVRGMGSPLFQDPSNRVPCKPVPSSSSAIRLRKGYDSTRGRSDVRLVIMALGELAVGNLADAFSNATPESHFPSADPNPCTPPRIKPAEPERQLWLLPPTACPVGDLSHAFQEWPPPTH
ncbi:hypothetical protein K437DRAFT_189311 [Tilletiaria anomala UBC 951]|uniref:Uncharacterized protein n=1 Tax=Tilletiaria anomala (strain ATCC 24038 / CBS 436.72 / UBC 951) TaxID=1037660 RepID=A0A066VJE7_TILAU|nr:uncharacterized protein K437DRAFT_189311 [Tilletiaria anomala UBC 951]KDN40428.1 hypothetical protein K437DRAFT_189311 [Tilletiaria anomala UBC 951]